MCYWRPDKQVQTTFVICLTKTNLTRPFRQSQRIEWKFVHLALFLSPWLLIPALDWWLRLQRFPPVLNYLFSNFLSDLTVETLGSEPANDGDMKNQFGSRHPPTKACGWSSDPMSSTLTQIEAPIHSELPPVYYPMRQTTSTSILLRVTRPKTRHNEL